MALFQGIQEYIALDANNITLVFDSGNIVNISGNIFLYPHQGHPILYNYPLPYCFDFCLFQYEGGYLDMFLTQGQRNYYNTLKRLSGKKPQKTIKRPKVIMHP